MRERAVSFEREELLTGLGIPYLQFTQGRWAAAGARDQAFSIWAKDHAHEPSVVPLEGQELFAGLGIPYPDFTYASGAWDCNGVGIAIGQAFAVGAKCHASSHRD